MSLTYKKADPLVYGSVKKLTCITKAEKQPHHEEQYYYIFWVSHINKVHMCPKAKVELKKLLAR